MPTPIVDAPTDSPVELASNGIKIRIRWKFITSVVGALLGSLGLAGIATLFNVGTSVADDFTVFKSEQRTQHTHINTVLETQDKRSEAQDGRIEDISKAVTSVQTTQQRDVARTEARRLTEKIQNRADREEAYDRLYELNLVRLRTGRDPCANVNCD